MLLSSSISEGCQPAGDGRFYRSDGQGEIEPDESYIRLISSKERKKLTVVVEVGWSQQLAPVKRMGRYRRFACDTRQVVRI